MHAYLSQLYPQSQPTRQPEAAWSALADNVEVREILNTDTPAVSIVREFHRLWSNNQNCRPTRPELNWANELMDQYGRQRVEQLLPKVVRTMQTEFRKAKSFGATRWHFPAILDKHETNRQRRRDEHLTAVREEIEESQVSQTKQDRKHTREQLQEIWDGLSDQDKTDVEQLAFEHQKAEALRRLFRNSESQRMRECLKELDRQRAQATF